MPNPIAIITFHHFSATGGHLSVPSELLRDVLCRLKTRYTFISYDQFKRYLSGGVDIPPRQVLVTIDDGYLDNYLYGYPIFQALDIPVVIFLITGFIHERSRCRASVSPIAHRTLWEDPDPAFFLNTAELQTMSESGLVSYGSHSFSHKRCMSCTESELSEEFDRSYSFMRTMGYDHQPFGFCWPGGAYDRVALEVIRKSPYEFAFGTVDGGWRCGDDRFTIRRIDCSSFSGDRHDYTFRLKRKLWTYTSKAFGHWYSAFKRIRESALNGRLFTGYRN